jgi:neutral ceramidase
MKVQLPLAFLALAASSLGHSSNLRAAAGKVDITPPPGELLWGFESRTTPATGTLDPLYARVLLLEAGTQRLALVTLDLGRSFGPAAIQQVRESVRKSSGITCLLMSASHTHGAPVVQDFYKNGTPAWERAALTGIERAIEDASKHLVEARIGTGTGSVYIGHNRLKVKADGSVSWFERNTTQIPTAPVDPTVTVVRVDRMDGSPLAVLVNYACHPVVFGGDNLQYTADFPAVTNRVVEAAMGAGVTSLYLQGAPGDINPYHAVTRIEEDAAKMREWTGARLGNEVVRVAKEIHTEASPSASINAVEEPFTFRLRWNLAQFQDALLKFLGEQGRDIYGAPTSAEFSVSTTTVLIDKEIAITTIPGEPFVDFQTNWRDRCPVKTALLAGYTNGYYAYFPTITAATRGGYGAASAATWAEPGAGERMIDRAIVHVNEMLGRLVDLPDELRGGIYQQ